MFKIKRFRKIIMNYYKICSENPEVIKQNPDLYIEDLQNLICSVNYYLFDNFILLADIVNIESKLSTKSTNIFWKFLQKIVDWVYDETLYHCEELNSCRLDFVYLKVKIIKQINIHNN